MVRGVSTPSIRWERHEERRPRPFIASSGLVAGSGLAVCPGFVLVVGGVVAEAAVEDADEAVTEGAQGLVVQVAWRRGGGRSGRVHLGWW